MTHKKENSFEFDDCPICQAMKKGTASTEEELKEAFQKAKEKGSVVGGKWFEEEK